MKKQMLSEGEIRKMMKFANIQKLTENFLDSQIAEEEVTEEETINEEDIDEAHCPGGRDDDMDEATHEEMDVDVDMDEPAGEEELDLDVADDAPSDNTEIAQQLASGIADLLSKVLDVEVDADMDAEPEEEVEVEDDLDLDAEEPGGRDMYEEESLAEGDDDELKEEEDKEELKEEEELEEGEGTHKGDKLKHSGKGRGEKKGDEAFKNEALDSEDLVNEITRRVAKRLLDLRK
tara:strand:- start:910 stop:1611 length:702 start_codon:yes stop_codon:yes gene_type:complete